MHMCNTPRVVGSYLTVASGLLVKFGHSSRLAFCCLWNTFSRQSRNTRWAADGTPKIVYRLAHEWAPWNLKNKACMACNDGLQMAGGTSKCGVLGVRVTNSQVSEAAKTTITSLTRAPGSCGAQRGHCWHIRIAGHASGRQAGHCAPRAPCRVACGEKYSGRQEYVPTARRGWQRYSEARS